ncbi:putative ribonuclease H-like domain-containing protein [Tanacetum coccineum]
MKVWTLVDLPYDKRAIGTKWVYRNKKDDRCIVVRNKARLVAQGYTHEEGFEDPDFPNKVFKVEKALYGLHQDPRASYKTLSTYLLENGFIRGTIDKTLFIKKDKGDILLVQNRSLIFALSVKTASTPMETNKALLKDEEAADVDVSFKQINDWISNVPNSPFDLEAFSDSDYASSSLDRKSTTGDETVIKGWEDRMEMAATTASSLEAEQDSDTILGGCRSSIRFKAASKQSNDPPLSRVNTLGSEEDNMKLKEMIEFCTKLSIRALDL